MNRKLDLTYSGRAGAAAALALAACLTACGDKKDDVSITPDGIDVNGDGKNDTPIDTNGDGKPDGYDTDGDGMIDTDPQGNPIDKDGGVSKPPPPCVGMYCDDAGTAPPPPCGSKDIKLQANTTNVMFLIDGSASMAPNWSTIRGAMADIINANAKLNFGAHVFWAPTDILQVFSKLNVCGDMMHPRIEVAPNNGQTIVDAVGPQPPGSGGRFLDTSPVLGALNWYLENDTPLNDPKSANFLVVVSDLVDTCFGTFFSNPDAVSDEAGSEQLLAFEKLAVELRKRNISLLPIGFAGSKADGTPGMAGDVNEEALISLTKLGGSSLSEPLLATSDADIKKAIEAIGVAVQPCRFTIDSGVKNSFKLNFLLNNFLVPRDRTNTEGWNFVQGDTSEVQFYGDACRAVQAGRPVVVQETCDEQICATGAKKLESKERALHVLLDGSASMWGNVFDALSGKLSPWGQATSALASMVTAPINDDLEFGFQFFPKGADFLGCSVEEPEVNIGPSSEISIIEEMVGNIPQGSTPLVAALERTAANPGRLADPNVLGTVLVVSDGGEACVGDSTTRPTSLATAANALFNKGVKTYAVRFGSAPSAEEDAQLQNIATNGGTDKYLTAPDGKALTEILSKISTDLFSCSMKLGPLPTDAKGEDANVYVNGIQIPLDDKNTGEGWHWISDAANGDFSQLELQGQACELMRKSRLSDIVIEFGCKSITVD
jgi:hypothetical protein